MRLWRPARTGLAGKRPSKAQPSGAQSVQDFNPVSCNLPESISVCIVGMRPSCCLQHDSPKPYDSAHAHTIHTVCLGWLHPISPTKVANTNSPLVYSGIPQRKAALLKGSHPITSLTLLPVSQTLPYTLPQNIKSPNGRRNLSPILYTFQHLCRNGINALLTVNSASDARSPHSHALLIYLTCT